MQILFFTITGAISGLLLNIMVHYFLCIFAEEPIKRNAREIIKESFYNRGYFTFIEITTILITCLALYKFGYSTQGFLALFFCYSLIVLSFVDIKTQILPDLITKPLIGIGIIVGYGEFFTSFTNALWGAFWGYFVLWSINTAFRLIRKKEGMGYGDFKLLSAIGAWAGATQLPLVIFMSSIMGVIIALITLKLSKQSLSTPTPFGPSLAITGIISLLYGKEIINAYVNFIYSL